jgi:hypothetical protein
MNINMNLSLIDNKGLLKKLEMKTLFQSYGLNSSYKIKLENKNKTTVSNKTIDRSQLSFTPVKSNSKKKLLSNDLIPIINKLKKNNELNNILLKSNFRKSDKTYFDNSNSNKSFLNKTRNVSYIYNNNYNNENDRSKILTTMTKENSYISNNSGLKGNESIVKYLKQSIYDKIKVSSPVRQTAASKDDFTFRNHSEDETNNLHNSNHMNSSNNVLNNISVISNKRAIFEMKKVDNPIRLKHNGLINTIKVKIRNDSDTKSTKQSFYKLIKLDPKAALPKFTYSHKVSINSNAGDEQSVSFNNDYKIESRSTTVNESIKKFSRDSPKIMTRHPHIRDFFEK